MFTIDEIQKQTGLQIPFIRKCVKSFDNVLSPHIQRGDHNSLLFNDNASIIFDKIKQFKEEGLSIVEIGKKLESIKTEIPKVLKQGSNSNDEVVELHRRLLSDTESHYREKLEYEKRLSELERDKSELERKNLMLENSLKLLPEGKPPKLIKTEWEQSQARKLEISGILSRLEELDGRAFKGKERKKLIKRLRELQS